MLSLIICTYQRPQEVRRLLEALIRQTYLPDEIIVVDGSLDDQTEQVIEKNLVVLRDRLIYLRVDEKERGLTRQRNAGIKEARGDIVAFLDDDTIPDMHYFAEILDCFKRHPEAVGVGGLIINEVVWRPADLNRPPSLGVFRWDKWERREDIRWRLRKLLGLTSPLPPGWMPPSGHGRPASYPPDGNDYPVEFIMGGASAWRKNLFEQIQFSRYFAGYGLYEDLDFCIRASKIGPIYLCTRAQLEHYHATGGRPWAFLYGTMVVRNGWYVWRRRWKKPSLIDQLKWWTITFLLAFLRLVDFRNGGFKEGLGRLWGMITLLINKPNLNL